MRSFRLIASRLTLAALGLSVTTIASAALLSCTSEEPATEADAPAQLAVDPRFATAESLIAEFNRLTTTAPVDFQATVALIYVENALQRKLVELATIIEPVFPLAEAFEERFRQPIDPRAPRAFQNKPNGPATIKENHGERATATYTEFDGKTETLELVKYNGRWWISGYTLEHKPEVKDATDDDIAVQRISTRALAAAAPALAQRIRAGEFASADQARQAIQTATAQQLMQNQQDVAELQAIAQRNPKYSSMLGQQRQGQ